jgi:hypothetical protein
MHYRPRKMAAALAGMLCIAALSLCSGVVSAKNRPVRTLAAAQRSAKSSRITRVKVIRLKKTINYYRNDTWKWQEAVHKPHTHTSYAERYVVGPAFLRWEAKLWNHRRLAVKKYAKTIFANHGYMPPTQARMLGQRLAAMKGWTGQEWSCLDELWGTKNGQTLESGWFAKADNPHSSAHGIPQALPGSKMGPGWESSAYAQINWGLGYILQRYHTPCGALSFRLSKGSY